MNRALIGVQALLLASVCIVGPAQAVPAGPPRAAIAAAQSAPLVPADYYHRNRYRHGADPAPVLAPGAADSAGVKPGQWEFTTRLEAFATPSPPPGTPSPTQSPPQSPTPAPQAAQPQSGGDATYLSCIQSDRAVPVEFGAQCKLDSPKRQGSRVTWSMICTNPQGAVRSDGVAQYHGDTMDATLVNHFPAANGTVTDLTQRITGRYLRPCPQVSEAPVTPPHPNAPANASPNASSGSSSQWVEPPAAAGSAAASAATAAQPPAAAPQDAASAAPAEPLPPPRVRSARQRRHYYYRPYYGYGGGLFGIRLPFLGGL
jgi:hypothetical protein